MSDLEIKDLSKNYGRIRALKNLSLSIEKGSVYGLLGPNGSGKTTTLGIILGIIEPDSGEFIWFEGEYGADYRRKIGAILETPNFYPYMNADENLDIIRHIKKSSESSFDGLLEMVNLAHRRHSNFSTYSLGMKQRLAIAATLVGDPDVLIFDEPTNGLDPQGIVEVREILLKVAETGKTVIMASHLLDEIEKICSHVAILKNGELLAHGPIGQIIHDHPIVEISSDDNENLWQILSQMTGILSITRQNKFLEITLSDSVDIVEFSRLLNQKGIFLTHLVVRKTKLEKEFLTITGQ